MKIRTRLALFGAGLAALGMFLFAIALTNAVGVNGVADQIGKLTEVATATAESLDVLPNGAPAVLVDLESTSEIFVVVVDDNGDVVYSEASEGLDVPTAIGGQVLTWAGRDFRTVGAPTSGGTVFAAQSVEFVDEQAQGFRAVVWIATLITVFAATIVSWFVSGRALRPLRQLADTTDAIGSDGGLSRRLPLGNAKDEVGRLSLSFNSMLDRLQSALEKADSNLEQQRRFVADASHDLRTPLTTIRANAGFLVARRDASADDRMEAVSDIAAEADRMAAMLDDLSMLATADSDRPLQYEATDLAALAGNAAARADRVADRAVTVHGTAPLVVNAEKASMERVLWILIDNALRHGNGPVQIGLAEIQGGVRVSVRDQGSGIAGGNEDQIFDRFYREESSRTSDGSGIGLSIVKAVIEQHGGTVSARNLEPGFEVAFQLPH